MYQSFLVQPCVTYITSSHRLSIEQACSFTLISIPGPIGDHPVDWAGFRILETGAGSLFVTFIAADGGSFDHLFSGLNHFFVNQIPAQVQALLCRFLFQNVADSILCIKDLGGL
jgi:hypothetical protein